MPWFLLLIRYVTLWPWTLTPWPWPLTFDLEHLRWAGYAVVKLCTKFEQSAAELLQFELCPYDLEHVSHAPAMLWDSLHKVQTQSSYPFTKCDDFFHASTSCPAMTLTFDPWPWTFVVVRAPCAQTLRKIWAKSNNPLQSYWRSVSYTHLTLPTKRIV